jgi:hypothetical protein
MSGRVVVEANSLKEAQNYAEGDMPLPHDSNSTYYVDDSFEIEHIEEIA